LAPIDTLCFEWVVSESQLSQSKDQGALIEEIVSKVFTIFVERSHSLYAEDETLMWLREIIGYTLNKLDSGDIDTDLLSA